MPPDERTPRAAHCPRCGYDLRGTVATWADACPLEGVCNECGLAIIWAEVLCPEKFEPRWSIEFEPKVRRVPLAAAKTYLRSLCPWGFWGRMRMSHEVRWGRLWWYLLLLLAPVLITYVIFQSGIGVFLRYEMHQQLEEDRKAIPAELRRLQSWATDPGMQGYLQQFDPKDRETVRKQMAAQVQQQILLLQQQQSAGGVLVDHSYLAAIIEAVFFPLASNSWGRLNSPRWGTISYPAPSELHQIVREYGLVLYSAPGWVPYLQRTLSTSAESLGIGTIVYVLFPATFILLPISRRRAKVRWRHIGRVTLYSAFIPATILTILAWFYIAAFFVEPVESAFHAIMVPVSDFGPLIGLVVWWAAAIRRYLKIPHAEVVAIVMTILSVVILFGAIFMIGTVFSADGTF